MSTASLFRSVAFVVLGSAALCPSASAQVCTGAFNDVRTSPPTPGDGVRPLAFKLDPNGALFSTCAEDKAADSYVYIAPGALPILYLQYDLPVLKTVPTTSQVLLSIDVPFNPVNRTVKFVADGHGGVSCDPVGCEGLSGTVTFGSSPNGSAPHYVFDVTVQLGALRDAGNQVIWTSSSTIAAGPGPAAHPGPPPPPPPGSAGVLRMTSNFETTFDSGVPGPVSAFPKVPLAAHSLTQHVRDTLVALQPRLTKKPLRDKLKQAIDQMADALAPMSYLDEGHLKREGDKVFRSDKNAVVSLLDLLSKPDLPSSPPESVYCRSSVSSDGVAGPLAACTQLLFGIPAEVAITAIDEFTLAHPGSPIVTSANAKLVQGIELGEVNDPRAIDRYREAWMLVTR